MTITETDEVSKRSTGMKQVMQALLDLKEASTDEIVDHNEVEIKESQVRKHLTTLDGEESLSYRNKGRGKSVDMLDTANLHISVRLP
jgi:predicted ArsR family transcriptional regulator